MTRFTTRPEIRGSFGAVAATHWLAAAAGFGMMERGGNAFDAAVAAGLVLQVVEPHLNGPGGEMPALVRRAGEARAEVLCGQGVAPAGATVAHYRAEGLARIPGSGLLATVVPGAFDAWMLLLRDCGTMELSDVMAPAIHYAERGHPLLPGAAEAIAESAVLFRDHWPGSAELWLRGGRMPGAGETVANPLLAATFRRLLVEGEGLTGRETRIEAARRAWREGFVAEAVDRYLREAEVMDGTGQRRRGVLTGADMAGWEATWETPALGRYGRWTVAKTGPWGQGPAMLEALAMLDGSGVAEADPRGADFVHLVTEALKLAMADRDAYYGDPDHVAVPLETLLSDAYAAERRAQIGPEASSDFRPGAVPGHEDWAAAAVARAAETPPGDGGAGSGEPTMAHLARPSGDTVHVSAVDAAGNMVACTPSGGWLQSSPAIPGLGFALNTRAQMFWLEEGLPSSLAPGRRPRTTLTPSLAFEDGEPRLVFGTPGGDAQDQWQLALFLRRADHGMGLQEAIDAPLFHTTHAIGSFHPRAADPGGLTIEAGAGERVLAELRRRGHRLTVAEPWSVGRLCACGIDPDGTLRAAATPRLMQAYAVGR